MVKKSVYRTSDDLKNLAAPGDVEIGVALHLRAERFIGRVVLHALAGLLARPGFAMKQLRTTIMMTLLNSAIRRGQETHANIGNLRR